MTTVPIWLEVAINDLGLTEADFKRFFKARRVRTVKPIYVKAVSPHMVVGDTKASRPGSQSWRPQPAISIDRDSEDITFSFNVCDDD